MKPASEFRPYPLARIPAYSRWLASGAALVTVMIVGSKWVLSDLYAPMVLMVGGVSALLLWLLVFLLRVLHYRVNRHNAHCYAETVAQVQQDWWARHRQKIAMIDSALLGPACSKPEHRQMLFSSDYPQPKPTELPEGKALRLAQVFGVAGEEREKQLAVLLALQWSEQQTEPIRLQPLRCYWQGSFTAWKAFVEQMAKLCPQVQLPEQPEPWQGIDSLDTIVDQLQGASADARVLCAGCHSSPIQQGNRLPAGEGAVLWLLAPQGAVRINRGEWYAADVESLTSVAERAQQQSELKGPPSACVLFSKPDLPDLTDINWNTRQNLQDANFGALGDLEAMVALTLAASRAQQLGKPCAWLAHDPHHTLALGVVETDDSSN